MGLPDESQWDETTCKSAVCQHPQCWATIRRIERGHPRILGSPCKTLDVNEKPPVLTVVNISASCFLAKRRPQHPLPGFTLTKPHSLLSWGAKFDSKFPGRPRKDLPEKDFPNRSSKESHRLKKLPVLNLNETPLPCPQDVRNMVVVWIPKEQETQVGPAKKSSISSQDGKKKREASTVKCKPSLLPSGKQDSESQLSAPRLTAPPPSPADLSEQPSSEFLPFWDQSDTVPQYLLNALLSDEGKTMPCPEVKTQLSIKKKKPPLEKSCPDSAISAQMGLSIHRLTLQRPALRHPERLRKLYYHLRMEDQKQQQQQWQQQKKLKTPTKKQEAKRKSKSGPGSQSTWHKRRGPSVCDPWSGSRTPPGRRSNKKGQQPGKKEGCTWKQDSTKGPQRDLAEDHLDPIPRKLNAKLSKTEPANEDEIVSEAQERTPEDLSASTSRASWSPELKPRRIPQFADYEDKEDQLSETQREESLEAKAESSAGQPVPQRGA
ncbi:uncharacterized protein C9orf43 homolog [Saccopteryx leptura]|uniref:uncharacterized protein C9orf43 homolog n=1 Tax=Saccopteryx leptura TaxID=249018 RepID=UPI00339D14A0